MIFLNVSSCCQIATPHLPPGLFKLWSEDDSEEEDESDEDPSDEEKQSDEQNDSQEPGSEGEDHGKSGNNSNDDNKNDNNDDDDDDDDDNNHDEDSDDDSDGDTNEQNNDKNAKKKAGMKKTGKFAKNKKVKHNRKMKSNTHSKKYDNHKLNHKKERVKRQTIPINVREKLHARKNERNHVKQVRKERLKKTLEATTPQISTEETTDEDDNMKQYADYISKVGRAIAKVRGVDVSEEHMNKDIQDMIDFQIKLVDVSVVLLCQTMKRETMFISSDNNIFQIAMDFDDEEMTSRTLNDFQKWYDKKKPKTVNSAVCRILIN